MENEVLTLQQRFDAAEEAGDKATVASLLSKTFQSIGPKGFVLDAKAWVDRHDLFKYKSLQVSDVHIVMYDKAAIVRNVQENDATYNGEAVRLKARVSQVWVLEDGQWLLAGIQFSPLA
jgi:hypothetical protein